MNLDCKAKLFCVDKPGVVVTFSETYLTATCYQWLCDLCAEKKIFVRNKSWSMHL